jgi:hypothetical protein
VTTFFILNNYPLNFSHTDEMQSGLGGLCNEAELAHGHQFFRFHTQNNNMGKGRYNAMEI